MPSTDSLHGHDPTTTALINSRQTQTIRYGTSASQYLLFTPSTNPPSPLVVILHGGFWKSRYGLRPPTAAVETLAPDLHRRGFAVVEIEYRRDQDPQWGWPHTNHDVLTAFNLALSLPGVDDQRTFVIGHSAGATLALWLAAHLSRQAHELIVPAWTYALAPVADLRYAAQIRLSDDGDAVQKYMHGDPEQIDTAYEAACPMDSAKELCKIGLTLAVGSQDRDVPPIVAQRLHERITHSAKREQLDGDQMLQYVVFADTDHYQIVSAHGAAWSCIVHDIERRAVAD